MTLIEGTRRVSHGRQKKKNVVFAKSPYIWEPVKKKELSIGRQGISLMGPSEKSAFEGKRHLWFVISREQGLGLFFSLGSGPKSAPKTLHLKRLWLFHIHWGNLFFSELEFISNRSYRSRQTKLLHMDHEKKNFVNKDLEKPTRIKFETT